MGVVKESLNRYGLDFRYSSKAVLGLMIQGERWQGHNGTNQTTVGQPAQGACLDITICGGSGAPGQLRRTWYVLAKYLISDGWCLNRDPTIFYEEFDPSSTTLNDLYTRLIVGATYFEQVLPNIQAKLQINYEFRKHQRDGTGQVVGDLFDRNVLFVLLQLLYVGEPNLAHKSQGVSYMNRCSGLFAVLFSLLLGACAWHPIFHEHCGRDLALDFDV